MLKIQLIVEELEEELRVDKYIANNYDEVSRSELKYYFDEDKIYVNSKLAKPSLKVVNGDIIDILERDDLLERLVKMQFVRNNIEFDRGTFRSKGDNVDIIPTYEKNEGIFGLKTTQWFAESDHLIE